MELTARSPSCFSSNYVLQLNGRALGEFKGRWFSESLDIRLTDQRRWTLHREGWVSGRFSLLNETDEVFGTGRHKSWLSSRWLLELSVGECQMVSAGLFNTGYVLEQHGRQLATVRSVNWCEGGWAVQADDPGLDAADLVLVGLIYHVIVQRRRSSGAAAAS
ncbi:MAG: hypothetical protein AAF333_15015 [Planctomycetota bacterium]